MKFQKLQLVGFKSFAEPSEFLFEMGLTGIVGPNGCGKSNIVEALRWVMGESSYKSLRASGMDEVIFSGTNNRPGRNSAEITLILENDDKVAPAEFNESEILEVSRRIERESGSTYRINGRDVRARDVQLLFADASTGFRSNALVSQGQIGELISAKPTSRRLILEEAAGITGLHTRRHEAELRLNGAETNLERLNDILVQYDGQLEGLKKQSRQAVRYRNISSDIRKSEATILHLRWIENKAQLEDNVRQFNEAESAVEKTAVEQGERAKEQANASGKITKLRDESSKSGEVLQRHKIAVEEIDAEEKRIKDRCQELQDRIEQLTQDGQREEELLNENSSRSNELELEKKELEKQETGTDKQSQLLMDAVSKKQEALKSQEAKFDSVTTEHARNLARQTELEKAKEEGIKRVERLENYISSISKDLEDIERGLVANKEMAESRKALEEAQSQLNDAITTERNCETATKEARELERSSHLELTQLERTHSELEAEARTIGDLLSGSSRKHANPVLDSIKVKSGYETAIGAALGEDLDAPVDEEYSVHWSRPDSGGNDPELPPGVSSLADMVEVPKELTRRLNQIGIVDRENGKSIQKLLKPGQRIVSKEGDLWRWDGFVVAAEASTPTAQRLEQQNRLKELNRSIEENSISVREIREKFEKCQNQVKNSDKSEQDARQKTRDIQKVLEQKRNSLIQIEQKLGQLTTRQQSQLEAKEHAETEREEAREALKSVNSALKLTESVKDLSPELDRLKLDVDKCRIDLAEAQANQESAEREKQIRENRLSVITKECQMWQERENNSKEQINKLRERRLETEQELEGLILLPKDMSKKREDIRKEVTKAENYFQSAMDELEKGEQELEAAENATKEAQEKLSKAREDLARIEERRHYLQSRNEEIERQIRESIECEPDVIHELTGVDESKNLPDMESSERRLERLKGERERLGGVNLLAEQEMNELIEQRDVMDSERNDVEEAIRKLRLGISNLNKEARNRLLGAFDQVNKEFQRLFKHLFGGGTAELQLVDSDDPLESGLEILARPPGKKPNTMTLLSGGEQALTCIALIFAVFLTNPAPICVLDEVDAPLDDANVERYCDLLNDMAKSRDTKFVVITHNPITMARMDRLFGVTMAERGVSQLVSVDLQTAEKFVETS